MQQRPARARASRLAVENDLSSRPRARGTGAPDALIAACADEAGGRGRDHAAWQTAKDDERAQI